MRLKIASVLLLAGTVVGCASNPPPPPPPPPEPAPAPAPAVMAPTPGLYKGTADLSAPARGCHAPHGTQTARVRGMTITVAGLRGMIGPDGAVTGRSISGTVTGGSADLTVKRGKCSYHYTLASASTTPPPTTPGTSGLPTQ
jgi:hypothetical protein